MSGRAEDPAGAGALLGTWRLIAWFNEDADGTRHHPLGEDAEGLICYSPDGYVFVSLSARGRTNFAVNDPFGGTRAENTQAMRTHITYSGRYRLEGNEVVHRVLHASCPNWVGSEQRRSFDFPSGDTLSLSADNATFNGRTVTARVEWARAE